MNRIPRTLVAVMLGCTLTAAPARSDWLTRGALVGGGLAVITMAEISAEMYAAISAAVLAGACISTHCGARLAALIAAHPLVGRMLAERQLARYAREHPGSGQAVAAVAADAGMGAGTASRQVDRNGRPIASNIPPPPGDCDPGTHQNLQSEVNASCKLDQLRRCLRSDSPALLSAKMMQFQRCATARTRINTACFRGGDDEHRAAAQDAYNGLANCQGLGGR